jgi:TP53 regulating kinase and related kinases
MEMIGEGAEAKLYNTTIFGSKAVIKRREEKKYRIIELDIKIRKERTKTEARIMYRINKLGIKCPKLIAVGKFSIYMKALNGKLLKDTRITMEALKEAGIILARMHNNDIVHGDFTPANLMHFNKDLYVIDFGLSEVTNSMEDKAIDLLLMKRSISENDYAIFEKAYSKKCRKSGETLMRLADVEKRGRYQVRTLA